MNTTFGPKCPAGAQCENRIFVEEYQKVDHEYERQLVRELAEARVRINQLQAIIADHHDPEEKRADGKRVRKDRWEWAVRRIAGFFGIGNKGDWDIDDVVEKVRALTAAESSGNEGDG